VPIGTQLSIGKGWNLAVLSVVPDAWAQVYAANEFNTPPAAGFQDFMIQIAATYTGSGASQVLTFSPYLEVVGASNVAHNILNPGCGVLPDPDIELSSTDVFTGGSITGNICMQVPATDVSTLELYTQPDTSTGSGLTQAWFALH
jgi:hypothetical protein